MDDEAVSLLQRLRAFGKALLFAFLVSVCIAVFPFILDERELAVASESWPSVTGRVLSSAVRRSGRTRRARVRYAYKVRGKELIGTRIRYLEQVTLEWASTTASRYRAGTPVAVYYDPAEPRESVLEPGRRNVAFLAIALSDALVLALAVGATFAAVRQLGVSPNPRSTSSARES